MRWKNYFDAAPCPQSELAAMAAAVLEKCGLAHKARTFFCRFLVMLHIKAEHVPDAGVSVMKIFGIAQACAVGNDQACGPQHSLFTHLRLLKLYGQIHGPGPHNAKGSGQIQGPARAQHTHHGLAAIATRRNKPGNALLKHF